ncbi:NmrA family NAD(P)-binding protein [uncultured Aquimarina sp.]|uniref:NmrA family NAD(P)-binding protein n=1 Tax=uncultured Aquimarina sp. TaxID=575652 RepID=UPI00260E01E2|nr:NmrA family NAD(P)-binding protein [uncultured Aquimarina sp.]
MKNIFLTGVTGNTGSHIVKELEQTNSKLTALVKESSPENTINGLRKKGLNVIKGDVINPKSYQSQLSKTDVALLNVGNSSKQLELEKAYIDVSKNSSLKHLVKFSAFSADDSSPSEILAVHGKSENYLKKERTPYTIVRPNFFMQNILMQAENIKRDNAFYLPMADTKVATIDIRDIATFFKTVLLNERDFENKEFNITGPEIISFHDMANILSEVLGRTIKYVPITHEQFENSLQRFGLDNWTINALSELNQYVQQQDAMAHKTDDYEKVTGKRPRTFKQFIEGHRNIFV